MGAFAGVSGGVGAFAGVSGGVGAFAGVSGGVGAFAGVSDGVGAFAGVSSACVCCSPFSPAKGTPESPGTDSFCTGSEPAALAASASAFVDSVSLRGSEGTTTESAFA